MINLTQEQRRRIQATLETADEHWEALQRDMMREVAAIDARREREQNRREWFIAIPFCIVAVFLFALALFQ